MPQTEITFIGGAYAPTQTGKDRWTLQANDGREFGVWDETVWQAVMQHLHQPLVADVYSKQSDSGTWWNTLNGVPALGVAAPRNPNPKAATASVGTAIDMSMLKEPLDRIAVALEGLLTMRMETRMRELMSDDPNAGLPDEPPAPDPEG